MITYIKNIIIVLLMFYDAYVRLHCVYVCVRVCMRIYNVMCVCVYIYISILYICMLHASDDINNYGCACVLCVCVCVCVHVCAFTVMIVSLQILYRFLCICSYIPVTCGYRA